MESVTPDKRLRQVPTAAGEEVLERLADRDPDHIYAAVSGGDDSIAALYFAVASDAIELDGVVHMDTGIGVERTRAFVEEQCEKLGLPLVTLGDDNARFGHERFAHLVRTYGFAGANPIAHSAMWKNLKDKPLSRFGQQLGGDVALISGVRKHESQNRYERLSATGVQEVGGFTWASPLAEFTDDDLRVYRDQHDVEENPVAALLCASGECLCGAFADREDLPLLAEYFPDVVQQIFSLEWDVLDRVARGEIRKEYALWAHGSVDAGEYAARTDEAQTGLMCTNCDERCPGRYERGGEPKSPAEAYLATNDLADHWEWPFFCAPCDRVVTDPYTHRQEVHPFDADSGLAGAWDMRQVNVGASHRAGIVLTEPNGWHLHANQLTTDRDEADRYASKHYYEDVSLSLCDASEHTWEPYNGGPVQECRECFAFNLSQYDATAPGPPAVEGIDGEQEPLSPAEEEAAEVHRQLSQF